MNDPAASVKTTLRVPGNWSHPRELVQRLPDGVRLTPDALLMSDGTQVEFAPMPPDEQFSKIFQSSCRRPATPEELAIVDGYTVNVGLIGPGGSLEAARTTMRAGAAILQAGGAGVFIDNSALAHGAGDWLAMAEDGGPDAISFAFVNIVRGKQELWTMGMHVLGLPEVVLPRHGHSDDGESLIIEVLRYMSRSDKPVAHGHILALEGGRCLQAAAATDSQFEQESPMHNPFGRLKLFDAKDIAKRN